MPNKPKHGDWDGRQHIGGNKWAGGTGGSGTAGLGGRGGPYRLDVGQKIVMLSEEQKQAIGPDALDAAKRMADEAYKERLAELALAPHDACEYDRYAEAVAPQVARMRVVLREHETRTLERVWLKGRPNGELDEARIVDGLTGASAIYKTRGPKPIGAAGARRRVAMRFVMDLSGSMYTFERLDGRKTRLLEVALFIMQALDGLEGEYALGCPSMPFHALHALPCPSMPVHARPCPSMPSRESTRSECTCSPSRGPPGTIH